MPLGFGGLDPGNLVFDGAAWAQSGALSLRPSQSPKSAAKLDVLQQHDKDLAAIRAEQLETTEADLIETIFPHPTLSEMMHESVLAAYGRVIHM